MLAHKDRAKSTQPPFFPELCKYFRNTAHAKLNDQTAPGETCGDLSEDSGMWIYVYQGLLAEDTSC